MGNIFDELDEAFDMDRSFRRKAEKPTTGRPSAPEKSRFSKGFDFIRNKAKAAYAEHKQLKQIEHSAYMQEKKKVARELGRRKARRVTDSLGEDINFKGFNTNKLFR